ncbi:MAG: protein-disulfide reductase DsbD, partial [Xanthomonadales bacterium]|nr:protein-disulfide reductase DsbD [Xanthomonadales bacterium]
SNNIYAGQDRLSRIVHGSSWWLILGAFFIAGLALAFTPCVYPMLPILTGIIAGAGEHLSTRRAVVLSLVYVLANAVVFAIAGVIAGLLGFNVTAWFQQPWLLGLFALLFVLLALGMFGFYELQLPASWQAKINRISNRQKAGSLVGVAIMGALSALIVGPCVTPALAVAIGTIGQTGSALLGGSALFALGLGMGAPLVAFGAFEGKFLPRAGAWMDAVKGVFGVAFLGIAIWMLSRFLDPLWIMLMVGALLVACAVYLGALDRLPEGASGWRKLWKALGVFVLILGAAELIGAAAGSRQILTPLQGLRNTPSLAASSVPASVDFTRIKTSADLDRAIAAASAAGKPLMLDFYADWCVACKEMEAKTFTQAAVQQALSGFVLVQADVTANDASDQALLKRFGLYGPPATLFFDSNGKPKRNARLIGFEPAEAFVRRVSSVVNAP